MPHRLRVCACVFVSMRGMRAHPSTLWALAYIIIPLRAYVLHIVQASIPHKCTRGFVGP